jgi:hypothetical protein
MEQNIVKKLVDPRLDEFTMEVPSIDEIRPFYSLENVSFPENRPYFWSNTLISLDGVVSVGQGATGIRILSLRNLPEAKARTDFKLLAAGAVQTFSPLASAFSSCFMIITQIS